MADFVEREKILALQTELHFDNIEQLKHWKCRHIDPIDVELLPAADVRPVVRGKWKRRKNWSRCVCSACSFESDNEYHFCPNCGADMRGE